MARGRVIVRRVLQVVLALVLGLVLSEAIFRWRDHGAFPHVNFYVPDARLGVRLEPGASQKLQFGKNPVTSLRTNSRGYRGGEWPAPGASDILVVGDSQVFGLGVEEGETFAARLGERTGRQVINAGVPTYGPREYLEVVRELVAERRPRTVIFTVNLVNDLFEVDRPNVERHVVWDGWAVRKENGPGGVTAFPGRRWLYRDSHLFFALRRWWHSGKANDDGATPSEGTWHDLASAGAGAHDAAQRAQAQAAARQAQVASAEDGLRKSQGALDAAARSRPYDEREARVWRTAGADPGDIVYVHRPQAEAARGLPVTAQQIKAALLARAELEQSLRAKAASEGASLVLDAFHSRDDALARLAELDAEATRLARSGSPLTAVLRELAALCAEHHAELVVLVLPIDVAVSPAEWKKYGVPAVDMGSMQPLIDDLAQATLSVGGRLLDATAALAAAEPGAFLDADIHLTPRGHDAVARALAALLAAPAPVPRVLAPGRTPVPLPSAFAAAPLLPVEGSGDSCSAVLVREWLKVTCAQGDELFASEPRGLEVLGPRRAEAMVFTGPSAASVVLPVARGERHTLVLRWPELWQPLSIDWTGAQPALRLGTELPLPLAFDDATGDATVSALCDCWRQVYGRSCSGAYGQPDPGCVASYPGDCRRQLACARRDPSSPALALPGAH